MSDLTDALGMLAVVGFYGGFIAVARSLNRKYRPTVFQTLERELATVAQQLGLQADGLKLGGTLKDPPAHVELKARVFQLGPVAKDFDYVVSAEIQPSLGLGLSIEAVEEQHFMERKAAPLQDVVSRKFDGGFHVSLRDPSRARSLISGPPEALLLAALARQQFATVHDDAVVLHTTRRLDVAALIEFIRSAAEIGQALRAACSGLPQLSPSQHAWVRLAAELGARFDTARRRFALDSDEGVVSFEVHEDGSARNLELQFDRPLPVDVCVTSVEALSAWDRTLGQDIRVGDRTFDDAFIVRCEDEAAARALLQAPARQALLALSAVAQRLEVRAASLSVEAVSDLRDPRRHRTHGRRCCAIGTNAPQFRVSVRRRRCNSLTSRFCKAQLRATESAP